MQKNIPAIIVSAEEYTPECINAATDKLFAALNLPADTFLNKKVFLKANLVRDMAPEKCGTSHPLVVAACAKYIAYTMGASSVTIGDSSGGFYTEPAMKNVYRVTQMDRAATLANEGAPQAKVQTNLNFQSRKIECGGKAMQYFDIIDVFLEADVVVNIGKLKTHSFTGYTGCVKNLFGLIPGLVKVEMHSRFPELEIFCDVLLDIEQYSAPKIALHILDAVIGMEGEGPTNGTPRKIGKLIASVSPYAADIAGVSHFTSPAEMPLLAAAAARGIIPLDIISAAGFDIVSVNKERIKDYKTVKVFSTVGFLGPKFVRAFLKNVLCPRIKIRKKRCVACGKCVRHCPKQALSIKKGVACVDRKKCIRCYCCQELCPKDAVKLQKTLIYRFAQAKSHGKAKK